MGQRVKFSIIIPVYNTENYLTQCMERVFTQTEKNYEVILVDDGSTDGSAQLCDKYKEQDKRVRVIHKNNKGVSSARNEGINNAKGEYLIFLDSDDYWEKDALEKIYSTSNKGDIDIIAFPMKFFQNGHDSYYIKTNNMECLDETLTYSAEEYLQKVLAGKCLYEWYPFCYAIKTQLWKNNDFTFDVDVRCYEDVKLLYQVLLSADKIKALNKPIYYYRKLRKNSLTTLSFENIITGINVAQNNILEVDRYDININVKKLLYDNFAHFYYVSLIQLNYLKQNERDIVFKLLINNKNLMELTINKKDLLLRKIISILGLHLTAKLLCVRAYFKHGKDKRQ